MKKLNPNERRRIDRLHKSGWTYSEIAKRLGRSVSTVGREVRRQR